MRLGECGPSPARGFTFVWVLAAITVFSIGLSAVGPLWARLAQREREDELLRIGALYAEAIASYRSVSPGSLKRYPPDLQSLLEDPRMLGVRRHLRKLYPDPLDPSRPWGLVRDAEGDVMGVYSQSEATPIRQARVKIGVVELDAFQRYSDWKFTPKTDKVPQ